MHRRPCSWVRHLLLKLPPNDTVPSLGDAIRGEQMSKSADLKARKAAAVPAGVGSRGVYVAKAENAGLWDVDGRRYIDFAAGLAPLQTGHPPPPAAGRVGAAPPRVHPHPFRRRLLP